MERALDLCPHHSLVLLVGAIASSQSIYIPAIFRALSMVSWGKAFAEGQLRIPVHGPRYLHLFYGETPHNKAPLRRRLADLRV